MSVFQGSGPVGRAAEPTRAQLVERAKALGVKVPPKATRAQMAALIESAGC